MGQISDQSVKGGVLGVVIYFLMKYNVDPALVALVTPMLAAVLAYASKKVGDPELASFFGSAPVPPAPVKKAARAKKAS